MRFPWQSWQQELFSELSLFFLSRTMPDAADQLRSFLDQKTRRKNFAAPEKLRLSFVHYFGELNLHFTFKESALES